MRINTWKGILHYLGFAFLFIIGLSLFIEWFIEPKGREFWPGVLMTLPLTSWVMWVWMWINSNKRSDQYTINFNEFSSEELARTKEYVERTGGDRVKDPERAKRIAEQRPTWGTRKSKSGAED